MTEQMLRDFAAANNLTVEKRITTGNEARHFATFALVGNPVDVLHCWFDIRSVAAPNLARVTHVDNPDHPDHGSRFIEVESVWCD